MVPQTDILALLKTIVPKAEQGLLLTEDGNSQIDFKQLLLSNIEAGKLKTIMPQLTTLAGKASDEMITALVPNDEIQLNIQNVLDYLNQSKNEVKVSLAVQTTIDMPETDNAPEKPILAENITLDTQALTPTFTVYNQTTSIVKTVEATTAQIIRTYNPDNVPEITWKSSNGQVNEAVVKWQAAGVEWQVSVKLDLSKNSLVISLPETRTGASSLMITQTDILNLQRDFKEHMTSNVGMNIVWATEKTPSKSEFTQPDLDSGRQSREQAQHQQQHQQRKQQKEAGEQHAYKDA